MIFRGVNRVIRVLIATDFFYNGAFASFAPVFAIFITGQIVGGSARVAGLATASYWVVKSIFQLPIARFLDRTDGERDDFWALFFGYLASSFVPFAFIFASLPWHLYAIEGFLGFVMAWAIPGWYAIFTRHVDKDRIGFEWSLQSVFAVGIGTACAAALGGYAVEQLGFQALFIISGIVSLLSSLLLLQLKRDLLPRNHLTPLFPEHPKR